MEIKEAIKIWKKLGIEKGVLEYNAGGDSMGDMTFYFYGKKGVDIESKELSDFFDNEIFDHVNFYVDSDGYYMGESGSVTIVLKDEEFMYDKNAQYEFSESVYKNISIPVNQKELKVIQEKIQRINGSRDEDAQIEYKEDCIISDTEEKTIQKLLEKIEEAVQEYVDEDDGDYDEPYFSFDTQEYKKSGQSKKEPEKLVVKQNYLLIFASKDVTVFKDDIDY